MNFKTIILVLLSSICILFPNKSYTKPKEGDIIFQISQSKQSPLIAWATLSTKTHCGIIIEKNSQLYVLETLNTIKLTPLQTFIDRGLGKKYWIKRGINKKINYKKYLGIPYDLSFKFSNGKYYCSELVYTIYLEQFGIQLCVPKQIKTYNIIGIKKYAVKRNMTMEQYVVSPNDIFKSKKLINI